MHIMHGSDMRYKHRNPYIEKSNTQLPRMVA